MTYLWTIRKATEGSCSITKIWVANKAQLFMLDHAKQHLKLVMPLLIEEDGKW